MDRLAPTRRPQRKAQGTQRWHELLFSHWEVDPAALKPLVHERLTIDTFEGRAFVGVVAFTMQHVQPWAGLPRLPTATEFYEINVRTYVHLDGQEPGIVFFSLDATSALAVLGARLFWGLPYYRSQIAFDRGTWTAERRWPGDAAMQGFRAAYERGAPLPASQDGTLEFFLAERYQFYARTRSGGLRRARVYHPPYPLHAVTRSEVTPAFLAPLGLRPGPRTPDYFSPGVDVEVFSLEDVP
jgi:uncharacterized protein YqjF (DUF2071 family)